MPGATEPVGADGVLAAGLLGSSLRRSESVANVANLAASVCPAHLAASGQRCEIRLLALQSLFLLLGCAATRCSPHGSPDDDAAGVATSKRRIPSLPALDCPRRLLQSLPVLCSPQIVLDLI